MTRRVPGVVAAAAAIYFFATNSEVVWLYGLTALFLAMVPVGLVAPLLAVRGVRVEPGHVHRRGFTAPFRQDREKAFDGDEVTVALSCRGNIAACRLGPVQLNDGSLLAVQDLDREGAPGISWTAARRGVVQIVAIQVSSSWPLGMMRVARMLPLEVTVVVHPRYAVPPPRSRAGNEETLGEAHLRGPGEEFVGLREYRLGDSQRRVHWPTTARAGKLMVVETAMESRSPARYRLTVAQQAPPGSVDLAATVAASLASGNVAGGRPFQLQLPGERGDVVRWADALTRLARVSGAEAGTGGEGVSIRALVDGVEVEGAEGAWSLPAGATLEDVEAALARATGGPLG